MDNNSYKNLNDDIQIEELEFIKFVEDEDFNQFDTEVKIDARKTDEIKDKLKKAADKINKRLVKIVKSKLFNKVVAVILLIFISLSLVYDSFYIVKARDLTVAASPKLHENTVGIYEYSINLSRKRIPKYSVSEIYKLDLTKPSGVTEEDLKKVTKKGLKGLEADFIEAEEKYGVNCVFLMSIAIIESGWGTMLFKKNNMFGFGQKGYATKRDNIMAVAKSLSKNYLKKGGSCYNGKTVSAVNKRYAASSKWDDKVASTMKSLYSKMYKENQKKLDKLEKEKLGN